MPRPLTPLPRNTEKHMRSLLRQATNAWEVRRIQCILMRVALAMSSEDIAPLVCLHPGSVRRIWMQYLDEGDAALLGEERGKARGNAHLTLMQEWNMLRPFLRKAETGSLITIKAVHAAACATVGKDVSPVTTYRMLARHGWRKIVPLPTHPKGNPKQRKNFKKAFSPTRENGSAGSEETRIEAEGHVRG